MKILVCADVQLAAVCTENLDVEQSHSWQKARMEKFADLLDRAQQNNALYVVLVGRLFGCTRVSESVIDGLFNAVREEENIRVLAVLDADEYSRISYRNDDPANLHVVCAAPSKLYKDDNISLQTDGQTAGLCFAGQKPIRICRADSGAFILSGTGKPEQIPSLEPIGFDDARDTLFGFAVLEQSDASALRYMSVENQKYAYKTIEIKVLPGDEQKEILRKIDSAVRDIQKDTFLRAALTGRTAFGLTINSDVLASQLQNRVFFAEVYDNTAMDIDEDAFRNDISLRSEFVRLALQDDFLSESERSRLISCGWTALNNKEVSEE